MYVSNPVAFEFCFQTFPFTLKRVKSNALPVNADILRTSPELRVKMPEYAALLRLRSRLFYTLHQYFMVLNVVHSSFKI